MVSGTTSRRALPDTLLRLGSIRSHHSFSTRASFQSPYAHPFGGSVSLATLLCRPREIRELTGFGWGPNITAEQGRALS